MTWETFDANQGTEATVMLDLLEELMDTADQKVTASGMPTWGEAIHACDGCGAASGDVDLWAEDKETGEQLWLCPSCGDW